MKDIKLTIVVPCYNEEDVLPKSSIILSNILHKMIDNNQINKESKILFVDDGSNDNTWKIIHDLENKDTCFSGIKFSKNFGHQNALLAGMTIAYKYSDAVITIDSDLQDDPNLIPQMIQKFKEGNDIVFAVRNDRSSDSIFKRESAEMFYKIMQKLGVNLIPDHADYRLLSHRALKELLKFTEHDPFLRGLVPNLGFPSAILYYKRAPRAAGTSKYPLKKMIKLAIDGITSNSIIPLKMITFLGLSTIITSGSIKINEIRKKHTKSLENNNKNNHLSSIYFLNGINLLSNGILGTYIGKIFTEVKNRPRYIIEQNDYTKYFNNLNHKD